MCAYNKHYSMHIILHGQLTTHTLLHKDTQLFPIMACAMQGYDAPLCVSLSTTVAILVGQGSGLSELLVVTPPRSQWLGGNHYLALEVTMPVSVQSLRGIQQIDSFVHSAL